MCINFDGCDILEAFVEVINAGGTDRGTSVPIRLSAQSLISSGNLTDTQKSETIRSLQGSMKTTLIQEPHRQ